MRNIPLSLVLIISLFSIIITKYSDTAFAQQNRCAGFYGTDTICTDTGDMLIITNPNNPSKNQVIFSDSKTKEKFIESDNQYYPLGVDRCSKCPPSNSGFVSQECFGCPSQLNEAEGESGLSCVGSGCDSFMSLEGGSISTGNDSAKSSSWETWETWESDNLGTSDGAGDGSGAGDAAACVGNACPQASPNFDPLNPPAGSFEVSGGRCSGFFTHGFRCVESNGKALMVPESWFNSLR